MFIFDSRFIFFLYSITCHILFLLIAIIKPHGFQEEQSPNSHDNEIYGEEAGSVEELHQVVCLFS